MLNKNDAIFFIISITKYLWKIIVKCFNLSIGVGLFDDMNSQTISMEKSDRNSVRSRVASKSFPNFLKIKKFLWRVIFFITDETDISIASLKSHLFHLVERRQHSEKKQSENWPQLTRVDRTPNFSCASPKVAYYSYLPRPPL